MNRKTVFVLLTAILFSGTLLYSMQSNTEVRFELRLYKAIPAEGASVFIRWNTAKVGSNGATYFYTGSVKGVSPSPEESEIKKVFKVRELQVLSDQSVKMSFDSSWWKISNDRSSNAYIIGWWEGYYGMQGPLFETTLADDKRYAFRIIPLDLGQNVKRFKLQIYEPTLRKAGKNVVSASVPSNFYVEADFSLPEGNTSIVGFTDSMDNAYFLSIGLGKGIITSVISVPSSGRKASKPAEPLLSIISKETQPKAVKMAPLIYPDSCKKNKIQGTVELEVTVNAEGRPENVKVMHSVHPDLDKAAVDAVRQWIFKPLLFDGRPRAVVFNLNILFELH